MNIYIFLIVFVFSISTIVLSVLFVCFHLFVFFCFAKAAPPSRREVPQARNVESEKSDSSGREKNSKKLL